MGDLVGKRILIVEDVSSIGMLLSAINTDAGCKVVGPADTSMTAIAAASASQVDAALLDVSLRGEFSYPVAEYLRERGVPFAFLTGYDMNDIPCHLRDHPVLTKPMGCLELCDAIERLVSEQAH